MLVGTFIYQNFIYFFAMGLEKSKEGEFDLTEENIQKIINQVAQRKDGSISRCTITITAYVDLEENQVNINLYVAGWLAASAILDTNTTEAIFRYYENLGSYIMNGVVSVNWDDKKVIAAGGILYALGRYCSSFNNDVIVEW